MLVAVKKTVIDAYMSCIEDAGLKAKIVDVDFFALQNLYEANYPTNPAEAVAIGRGQTFGKRTPRAAIFFGPPGTSKTELSEAISKFLGWSFLAIDPSFLLRNGMDGIQAEANAVFHRLEEFGINA